MVTLTVIILVLLVMVTLTVIILVLLLVIIVHLVIPSLPDRRQILPLVGNPLQSRVVLGLLPGELGLLVPRLVHGEPEGVRGPGAQTGQRGRAQRPGHPLL